MRWFSFLDPPFFFVSLGYSPFDSMTETKRSAGTLELLRMYVQPFPSVTPFNRRGRFRSGRSKRSEPSNKISARFEDRSITDCYL
jgi:hypothetical protein